MVELILSAPVIRQQTSPTVGPSALWYLTRATGTVTLMVSPRDPVTNSTVGVNLFQGGVAIASINTASAVPGVNTAGIPLSPAGSVGVQVYNYQAGATADYTIVISGTGVTP